MMNPQRQSYNKQSEGNLAVANKIAEFLPGNLPPSFPDLCVIGDDLEESAASDPAASARGMLIGVALSVLLGCVMVLVLLAS